MTTHHTHHTSPHSQGRDAAVRWLSQQLRWERLLDDLRNPSTRAADEEEAA
jgi:hypothetical protein